MPKDANQTVSKYDKDTIFLKTMVYGFKPITHKVPKISQDNFVQIRTSHSKTRSFSLRTVLLIRLKEKKQNLIERFEVCLKGKMSKIVYLFGLPMSIFEALISQPKIGHLAHKVSIEEDVSCC